MQFDTYRDEQYPHAQIEGVVADKTHRIAVEFDIAQTDIFETSVCLSSMSDRVYIAELIHSDPQ